MWHHYIAEFAIPNLTNAPRVISLEYHINIIRAYSYPSLPLKHQYSIQAICKILWSDDPLPVDIQHPECVMQIKVWFQTQLNLH